MTTPVNDVSLLKIFTNREVYEKYSDFVNVEVLEYETQEIFKSYKVYFETFPSITDIPIQDFSTWFMHTILPPSPRAKQDLFRSIFSSINENTPLSARQILHAYAVKKTRQDLEEMFVKGFDLETCENIIKEYEKTAEATEDKDEAVINIDIDYINKVVDRRHGLQWRLKCLNEAIGPLIKGDFGIIAAPVDVGKTTFCVSELSYMCTQISDGSVLWMNNEEFDQRVAMRLYQAVLGQPWSVIKKYPVKAMQEYEKRLNGDKNRVVMLDIRNKTLANIKRYFKKYKPKLAIIDQIDHINTKGYKAWAEVDRLKYLYSQIRTLANEYCPILAVTQVDATASWLDKATQSVAYQKYIDQKQLAGSKIDKAAAADLIITISHNPDMPKIRYIHVAKNKLEGSNPNFRKLKKEVFFNGEISRYED